MADNLSAFIQLYGDYTPPAFWSDYGVKDTGYVAPDFEDVIAHQIEVFKQSFQDIGEDIDIDPSSPEGNYIYNEARDKYTLILQNKAVFDSFNLILSSGNALERNLAYIGISKTAASKSQASVVFQTIDGVTPITLEAGYPVANTEGKSFITSADITFSDESDPVAVIAVDPGSFNVSAGAVSVITAPRANLLSVTNPDDGISGLYAESDPEARQRGTVSPGARAVSTITATLSQIRNTLGVLQARVFENKSDDFVGSQQAHSVRYVVRGGSTSDVGLVLYRNEVPGISYVGNGITSESYTVTESDGVQTTVWFDRPIVEEIWVKVPITTRNFDTDIASAIQTYAENRTYGLAIGEDVVGNKFYGAAYQVLIDNNAENDNEIGTIQVSLNGADYFDKVLIDSDRIGSVESARIVFETLSV